MDPPTFLEHIVILCFERRYPTQNSVICLKSNILAPQIFGLAALLMPLYPLMGFLTDLMLVCA